MRFRTRKRLFFAMTAAVVAGATCYLYWGLPETVNLMEGETLCLPEDGPLLTSVEAASGGVLESDGSIRRDRAESGSDGDYDLQVKLFGLLPVRSIHVNVTKRTEVVPCGDAIGIKIITDGALVVGLSEVTSVEGRVLFPAKQYDIREGDVIASANGTAVGSTEQFGDLVANAPDGALTLELRRGDRSIRRDVRAVQSADGYRLGLWVRDSMAGIGTLTFFEEDSGGFGALGHPVTDVDTGDVLTVAEGEILPASIQSVQKGERGAPGELRGIFQNRKARLGSIEKNTDRGIYGTVEPSFRATSSGAVPAASRGDVREGAATVLTSVDDGGARPFSIEIQKVTHLGGDSHKDMVIRVTDPALLETTGGIVQGMSGSPILQNGKLVGAVTHVFVNDPTRGYGIFIENMLAAMEG